jgi:hypothetical protein
MPDRQSPLYLHEEIMLLALRDQKGTVEFGSMYGHALVGAILAELLLVGRINIEEGKQHLVNVVDSEPIGEPVIDACLERIATAKRRASMQNWVQRCASRNKLHHRVAEGLCNRGILQADEEKILLIFSRKIYPEIDPEPERTLIERLREAIFSDSAEIDPRTTVLIALANAADLLRIPFDKRELKKRKARLEQLTDGDLMGKATKQAVQAVQTAILIACMMPIIITSISS